MFDVESLTSRSNSPLYSFQLWHSKKVWKELSWYGYTELSILCTLARYVLKYPCPVKNWEVVIYLTVGPINPFRGLALTAIPPLAYSVLSTFFRRRTSADYVSTLSWANRSVRITP